MSSIGCSLTPLKTKLQLGSFISKKLPLLAGEHLRPFLLKNSGKTKHTTLDLDLSRIKMEPKEKVKDFNQRFLNLLKRISQYSKLIEDVTIEFYTLALPMSMAMFDKNEKKG